MANCGGQRQSDDEGRALAQLGHEGERAAVLLSDLRVGDGEALAGAFADRFW